MSSTIRPIETRYAGCRFRSRLEARWAVFFDTLGVRWEYEPEGFELDDGDRYLPDFWLPEIETWFEVKGQQPTETEMDRLWRFAEAMERTRHQQLVIAIGAMPDPATFTALGHPYSGAFDMIVLGDNHYAWCKCPWCGKPGIAFDARGARVCKAFADQDKAYSGSHPEILNAYTAARSARFEHGEHG